MAGGGGGVAQAAAVYLEDSPAALELADEAAQLRAQGRLGEAAQRLQRLVETYPDKADADGPAGGPKGRPAEGGRGGGSGAKGGGSG